MRSIGRGAAAASSCVILVVVVLRAIKPGQRNAQQERPSTQIFVGTPAGSVQFSSAKSLAQATDFTPDIQLDLVDKVGTHSPVSSHWPDDGIRPADGNAARSRRELGAGRATSQGTGWTPAVPERRIFDMSSQPKERQDLIAQNLMFCCVRQGNDLHNMVGPPSHHFAFHTAAAVKLFLLYSCTWNATWSASPARGASAYGVLLSPLLRP
jgi:hypothetical protein